MNGLTVDEIRRVLSVVVPQPEPTDTWIFDFEAIADAVEYLELEYVVKCRYSSAKHKGGGHFDPNPFHPWHTITIVRKLKIKTANEVLWHELRHAAQCEAWAKFTGEPIEKFYEGAYRPSNGRWGRSYVENKFEIDAREFAAAHRDRLLLKSRTSS